HALRHNRKKENINLEEYDSSYFIVLLNENTIAWNEIDKVVSQFDAYNNFTPIEENGEKMRNGFKYIPKDYVDAVVVPWYRETNSYYRVQSSDPDKRPNSPFPKEDYASFSDYFYKKYNAKVTTNDQLLLDVKNVEKLFGHLKPQRKKKRTGYQMHLVPELCLILP
ncbi:endoribonuclease Dicer-like protein, partial [Leptotrombidium deliense]